MAIGVNPVQKKDTGEDQLLSTATSVGMDYFKQKYGNKSTSAQTDEQDKLKAATRKKQSMEDGPGAALGSTGLGG